MAIGTPCHTPVTALQQPWGPTGPHLWIHQYVGASFLHWKGIQQLEKGKQSFLTLRVVQHRTGAGVVAGSPAGDVQSWLGAVQPDHAP